MVMPRKRFTPGQIITKLREAEVELAKGRTVGQACRKIAVTEQTYYRWRKEYNTVRPHSSLGYHPPAPEVRLPLASCTALLHRSTRKELLETLAWNLVSSVGAGQLSKIVFPP
jgi:hypothetical protein